MALTSRKIDSIHFNKNKQFNACLSRTDYELNVACLRTEHSDLSRDGGLQKWRDKKNDEERKKRQPASENESLLNS